MLSLITVLFLTGSFGNLALSEEADLHLEDYLLTEPKLCSEQQLSDACLLLEGCYMSNRDDPQIPGTTAGELIDWCMDKIGCLIRARIKDTCSLPFAVYANGHPTVTGLFCNNRDITGLGVRGLPQSNVEVPTKASCDEKSYEMTYIEPVS
jgi:hypothetical protein